MFNGFYSCNASKTTKTVTNKEDIPQKVAELLSKMTIKDKVGEMTQLSIDMISVGEPFGLVEPHQVDKKKIKNIIIKHRVGSILNAGGHAYSREHWREIIGAIQDAAKKKKTGIPVIYGIDAIHGTTYTLNSTLFPHQSGLAMTWNTDLVKELAGIAAYETRASGIPWNFSPVLDVGRDPRWPRLYEGFGEDVLLTSRMGVSMVEGYQGDDISGKYNVAACLKHFVGYATPRSGRDRTPVYMPERQLRELCLPPFQAAIDAGAKTIMINSGEMNGIPVHADKRIMTDLLRNEMGFKGLVVTDWEDIIYLADRHRVAKNHKEAIKISINAGVDMSMVPMTLEFPKLLAELVKEGEVPMSRIDEAVTRILTLKYELGLFDQPYYDEKEYDKFASKEFRTKSFEGAKESIVLLKNEKNTLPLSKDTKVFVTGPTASSMIYLNGGWSYTWQGTEEKWFPKDAKNILEAITQKGGKKKVKYVKGVEVDREIDINAAVKAANKSDVIVACLGETPYTEVVGNIEDLTMPQAQLDFIKALATTGKPIILVLAEGRPRIINEIEELADAIVFASYPGNEGGRAIAEILYGDYNPSGKLAYTYPRGASGLVTYDHKGTELVGTNFGNDAFNPQFEFGHGLSYTSFRYKKLKLSSKKLATNGVITISVEVKNTGKRDGAEVVQLYISDKIASITPSVKRLRGFEKIFLKAGKSKTVKFNIHASDLSFIGIDNKPTIEAGDFEAMVGDLKANFVIE